ncbi:hypothetical protein Pan97_39930 [Bremerella volcania]|uniref:DNA repair photolyase n=1 Tax=Bremerella volcania TaxID=2527984 RepID=A0A518CCI5_9BACT|nr:DUF1848 domain-containing protein [Bremerella volcania]QDU76936.1 hypothetical protein Pan97_39930 [Bremerella volcania]
MIISASYKTDIPTFYGEWFMNRLRAGYCKMVNAWNRNQTIRVSLDPKDVDGFIFWTKNIGPFADHLSEIADRGYPFVIQHTINSYPRSLESSVVDANRTVEHFRSLAEKYGPRTCVWRYDTIVISTVTPVEFHLENFASLASQLAGTTDEVVISFVHLYKKTLANMNRSSREAGFEWEDPPAESKRELAAKLVEVANANGMKLSICGQRDFLVPGAEDARCIDVARLEEISGKQILAKQQGSRKECGCFASRDIGDYDTCPHGCVYCYAVLRRELAQRRYREHDPMSEFLFPQNNQSTDAEDVDPQGRLFEDD